jgi:hypothetical protein
MDALIETALDFPTVLFTALLGLVVLYWLVAVVAGIELGEAGEGLIEGALEGGAEGLL